MTSEHQSLSEQNLPGYRDSNSMRRRGLFMVGSCSGQALRAVRFDQCLLTFVNGSHPQALNFLVIWRFFACALLLQEKLMIEHF
jgi:hypothetical protein